MKTAFIGAGNMACAIVRGISKSNSFNFGEIIISNGKNFQKAETVAKENNITFSYNNIECVKKADIIVLCVKPALIHSVLAEISETIKNTSPLIISIAARKTLSEISTFLPKNARLARVMPNINATCQMSCSAFTMLNENVTDEKLIRKLLTTFGSCIKLTENAFSAFTSVAGCAPAYIFTMIDAMALSLVKNGINYEIALKIAAETVRGSAEKLIVEDVHPSILTDFVCSPGGTTIEGLSVLKERGFEGIIIDACDAAYKKDKKQ